MGHAWEGAGRHQVEGRPYDVICEAVCSFKHFCIGGVAAMVGLERANPKQPGLGQGGLALQLNVVSASTPRGYLPVPFLLVLPYMVNDALGLGTFLAPCPVLGTTLDAPPVATPLLALPPLH